MHNQGHVIAQNLNIRGVISITNVTVPNAPLPPYRQGLFVIGRIEASEDMRHLMMVDTGAESLFMSVADRTLLHNTTDEVRYLQVANGTEMMVTMQGTMWGTSPAPGLRPVQWTDVAHIPVCPYNIIGAERLRQESCVLTMDISHPRIETSMRTPAIRITGQYRYGRP